MHACACIGHMQLPAQSDLSVPANVEVNSPRAHRRDQDSAARNQVRVEVSAASPGYIRAH